MGQKDRRCHGFLSRFHLRGRCKRLAWRHRQSVKLMSGLTAGPTGRHDTLHNRTSPFNTSRRKRVPVVPPPVGSAKVRSAVQRGEGSGFGSVCHTVSHISVHSEDILDAWTRSKRCRVIQKSLLGMCPAAAGARLMQGQGCVSKLKPSSVSAEHFHQAATDSNGQKSRQTHNGGPSSKALWENMLQNHP